MTGKTAKMEETIKIMEFMLDDLFKKHLAKRIEGDLMNRKQANEEYAQVYQIVQLLKQAKAKGKGVSDLRDMVRGLPAVEKQSKLF